jgi:hypothetical protein
VLRPGERRLPTPATDEVLVNDPIFIKASQLCSIKAGSSTTERPLVQKDATVVTLPFKLAGTVRTPLPASVSQWIEGVIEKATGLETLDQLYRNLPRSSGQLQFLQIVLDLFAIQYRIATPGSYAIPEAGPVIIVANHPFGGLEGVILAHHLLQRRRDVRFLANYMLQRIPELRGSRRPQCIWSGCRWAACWLWSGQAAIRQSVLVSW